MMKIMLGLLPAMLADEKAARVLDSVNGARRATDTKNENIMLFLTCTFKH